MNSPRKYPISFSDNHRVDTNIRIKFKDSSFDVDVQLDGGGINRFTLDLPTDDVKHINKQLQTALQTLKVAINGDKSDLDRAIRKLVKSGKFAFNSIFDTDLSKQTIRKALTEPSMLQIESDRFFVPWELLYDTESDEDPIDVYKFWGMRHVVSRQLILESQPGSMVTAAIKSACFRIGLVLNKNLDAVARDELPTLEKLDKNGKISLSILRNLDNNEDPDVEFKKFRDFIVEGRDILHFACHGFPQESPPDSFLQVEKDFKVTLEELISTGFYIKENPFMILNACRTGTVNPLNSFNWAEQFSKKGARGVLATECNIPDEFAAKFIKKLYSQLLRGVPIGEALLATRQYFYKEQNNLLGLAYALYASPKIQLVRTQKYENK